MNETAWRYYNQAKLLQKDCDNPKVRPRVGIYQHTAANMVLGLRPTKSSAFRSNCKRAQTSTL